MATRGWLRLGGALVVVALAAGVVRADPDDEETTAARRALIVLRILAYDKALASRAPGDAVVVLVVAGADPEGRTEQALWHAGFGLLPNVKAGGRPVREIDVSYRDAAALDAVVAAVHPAAMIVTIGLAGEANALRRLAIARHVLAISTREADVRIGFGVGLIAGDKRDEITINVEAARAQGARFGAGLLQLARIVDGDGP